MNTPARIAARLTAYKPKVHHYIGAPPEVTGGVETRNEMPLTSVLLIERSEDGVLLIRYAANGQFAGDTWHSTVEEAKEQALFEFGESLSPWKDIPVDVNDVLAFMTSAAS